MVNVSVLVLRRDRVQHRHFTAPTAIPVIGAIVSLALMVFETEGRIAVRSLFLLGVGAVLFVVAWYTRGPDEPRTLDTTEMAAIEHPDARR
jgi:hypothetical protein